MTTAAGLACGELFNAEIGRQRAASERDNSEFWQSLKQLTDVVDANANSDSDRSSLLLAVLVAKHTRPAVRSTKYLTTVLRLSYDGIHWVR